ncbi:reverse transcriptase domain-containing protein [Tanacetum coccineum]
MTSKPAVSQQRRVNRVIHVVTQTRNYQTLDALDLPYLRIGRGVHDGHFPRHDRGNNGGLRTVSHLRGSFSSCLSNLDKIAQKIEDTKAKVDVISKLPHPTSVKGVRRPFPSSRGNKYILVVVDYLSKWVEAKTLPTNDARVVVKFLKSLFVRFGTPRAIISDRRTHFFNDQFAKVMFKYGVTHHLYTAYHLQTSGQVEVSNRSLKRILERTVGENRASWSDKLDDALWAFRTAFKTPIGYTPYKLTADDHRKVQMNELNELRDQAYENSLIYKEKMKKIHDSKIKNRVFNVGDRVLLFNSRLKIFSDKLKTRWTGPFTVAQVFPYGTIELSQTNGPNFKIPSGKSKVHIDVLSVLWGNRLPIPDGSLPLSSHAGKPQQFDWLLRRVLDLTAHKMKLGGRYDWKDEIEGLETLLKS